MTKKGEFGRWSEKAAMIAGYLGGVLTIAIYAGAPMNGLLGMIAQVGGGLGILAIVLYIFGKT